MLRWCRGACTHQATIQMTVWTVSIVLQTHKTQPSLAELREHTVSTRPSWRNHMMSVCHLKRGSAGKLLTNSLNSLRSRGYNRKYLYVWWRVSPYSLFKTLARVLI